MKTKATNISYQSNKVKTDFMDTEHNTTSIPNIGNTHVGSRYLTVKQLYDACQKHKYLLLRFKSGYQMGINCKVAEIAQRLNPKEWGKKTDFVSYIPCGLNEYIQHKHSFISNRLCVS